MFRLIISLVYLITLAQCAIGSINKPAYYEMAGRIKRFGKCSEAIAKLETLPNQQAPEFTSVCLGKQSNENFACKLPTDHQVNTDLWASDVERRNPQFKLQ